MHSELKHAGRRALVERRVACRPEYLEDEHGFKVRPEQELPFDRSDKQLFPVSVTWQPPFTMMVDLIGSGDLQVSLNSLSPILIPDGSNNMYDTGYA